VKVFSFSPINRRSIRKGIAVNTGLTDCNHADACLPRARPARLEVPTGTRLPVCLLASRRYFKSLIAV
jgi:hypothetical protein